MAPLLYRAAIKKITLIQTLHGKNKSLKVGLKYTYAFGP